MRRSLRKSTVNQTSLGENCPKEGDHGNPSLGKLGTTSSPANKANSPPGKRKVNKKASKERRASLASNIVKQEKGFESRRKSRLSLHCASSQDKFPLCAENTLLNTALNSKSKNYLHLTEQEDQHTPPISSSISPYDSKKIQNCIERTKEESSKLSLHCSFEDTDDESHIAPTQAIDDRPLKGLSVMVDVRASNENRSQGVSRELQALGAKVVKKYTREVTHVIFKEGRKSTLNIAEKHSLFLVSVLWVDSCKNTWSRVSEALFPAQKPGSLQSPLFIGKLKRIKSLQPRTFTEDVNHSGKREARRKKRAKAEKEDCKYKLDDVFKGYFGYLSSPEEEKTDYTPGGIQENATGGKDTPSVSSAALVTIPTIPGGDTTFTYDVVKDSLANVDEDENCLASNALPNFKGEESSKGTGKRSKVRLLHTSSKRSPLTTLVQPKQIGRKNWKSKKESILTKNSM